ncbi:MAG TPA: non-homologous end-joining DNA ligase [Opitutus sp.]|nr:non-homologous end-joining DNA ligase [Opitutus sp.]
MSGPAAAKGKKRRARGTRLGSYRGKRNLRGSGEPVPRARTAGTAARHYVIQKHAARRLHFDFRLEMEGVLRSWAVPKGLPLKPGGKALAIEVEDHPLEYGAFEGNIPQGNYGAGAVMLWDRGRYTVAGGDPAEAYRSGKLSLRLDGRKCAGAWTLIRLHDEPVGERAKWLLLRSRDGGERIPRDPTDQDRSVVSGRTMKEIAGGSRTRRTAKPGARNRRTPAAREKPRSADDGAHFVAPMLARPLTAPPAGDWLWEIKFDGYRALGHFDGAGAKLWSRRGNDVSAAFPEVVHGLRHLKGGPALVDGEVVALDETGHSSFQLLQAAAASAARPAIRYYVFDLLWWDGAWLLDRRIEERQKALRRLCRNPPVAIRPSPVFETDARALLKQVARQGLEGIVGKRRGSVYEPGRRSGSWCKLRLAREQEFVIGGFTPPQGARAHFGALLLGYHARGVLRYAGKVGTGFSDQTLAGLHRKFRSLHRPTSPFSPAPAVRGAVWLKPELVAQIRFNEWTRDGALRQPAFLALRDDKSAAEVVREPQAGR